MRKYRPESVFWRRHVNCIQGVQTIEEADEDLNLIIGLMEPYCNILDGTPDEIEAVNDEVRKMEHLRRTRQEARDPARFIARTVNARSILPCSLAIRRTRLRGLCPREVEISLSKNHETVIETLISPRLSMFELVSSEIERSNPKPRLDNFFLILRSVAYSTTYKAQPKPIRRCSKPAFNLKFSHPMTTRDLQARHKAPVGIFNSLSLQAQEL